MTNVVIVRTTHQQSYVSFFLIFNYVTIWVLRNFQSSQFTFQSIDFVLESRPSATVTIKLLDGNTSEPVKYAWFDFFDAQDEYAPIVFPNLEMIEFESDSFDGTYTLSVPGGDYKLAVGAHNYEGIFSYYVTL